MVDRFPLIIHAGLCYIIFQVTQLIEEEEEDVQQKSVKCKNCGKKFLSPPVDTGRQEISADIDEGVSFALICPFCVAHALYTAKDLE
jgi:hypothetical protein